MTGGEMIASAETSIDMGKAAATPTESESGTSAVGGAPAGGATAEAAAEAGAAVEERAGTGNTEEAEVRKSSPLPLYLTWLRTTNNNTSTGDHTPECTRS